MVNGCDMFPRRSMKLAEALGVEPHLTGREQHRLLTSTRTDTNPQVLLLPSNLIMCGVLSLLQPCRLEINL